MTAEAAFPGRRRRRSRGHVANRSVRPCYRPVLMRVWVVALAVFLASPSASARREKTPQVTPAKGRRAAPVDLSRGGERKGGIEFALGSITAVFAGVLIGRGTWELVNARRVAEQCAAGTTTDPTCGLDAKPGRGGTVAGSLSLGFSVPLGVASGFLFRHAVRIRRDHARFHREHPAVAGVAVSPWFGRGGGGLGLRLRF